MTRRTQKDDQGRLISAQIRNLTARGTPRTSQHNFSRKCSCASSLASLQPSLDKNYFVCEVLSTYKRAVTLHDKQYYFDSLELVGKAFRLNRELEDSLMEFDLECYFLAASCYIGLRQFESARQNCELILSLNSGWGGRVK